MSRLHAVIAGSFHDENMGDYALLKAFIEQHGNKYQNLSIIGLARHNLLDIEHTVFPQPLMAIGYRFWNGYQERIRTKKMIAQQIPDAIRHYIWMGGLLGSNLYHNRGRYKELKWASSFCNSFIYYFGDIEPGFNASPEAAKLIKRINHFNPWIAVRSNEAANLLVDAGFRSKINVGIDPALYARCQRWGVPFNRYQKDSGILAIVICQVHQQSCLSIWQAAAIAGISFGLKIRWISLCNTEDLALCQQLFREFSEQYPNYPMDIVSGLEGELGIAESSVCVATRFHGTIFGLTAGVPTIAIPYGAKIKRLFKLLNIEDWVVEPLLREQPYTHLNSRIGEKIKYAIQGKFRPDYTGLLSGIEAHQKALSELDLIISTLSP
jgi:hypothetical protein